MKKVFKSLLTALLFAFVIAALSGLGSVKASAATISDDLDGDGTDETIVYDTEESDKGLQLSFLTINGKDVLAAIQMEDQFYPDMITVEVIDTCTKDGLKELAVIKNVEGWDEYTLIRFKGGKISKYCKLDDTDGIVSQKKKSRITIKTDVFVRGLGYIKVNMNLKVKSGRAVLVDEPSKPNKDNEKTTFKTNRKMPLYADEYAGEQIGTLKKGAKFKLVQFVRDGEGNFTRICVKSNGVTGWIDSTDFDDYTEFFVKNPPVWE